MPRYFIFLTLYPENLNKFLLIKRNSIMGTTTIGWIGLGKMGVPMSGNLIKAGYQVTVYNRTREKEETVRSQGALTADSPADLLKQCAVVVLMVSDDDAVKQLFTGKNGL